MTTIVNMHSLATSSTSESTPTASDQTAEASNVYVIDNASLEKGCWKDAKSCFHFYQSAIIQITCLALCCIPTAILLPIGITGLVKCDLYDKECIERFNSLISTGVTLGIIWCCIAGCCLVCIEKTEPDNKLTIDLGEGKVAEVKGIDDGTVQGLKAEIVDK